MFAYTIDSKPKITTPEGVELVDLARSIFSLTAGAPVKFKIKQVTKGYIMRPDLVSLQEYGTDMRTEWILKYTGISNPFSFNEDDLIMIPEQDVTATQMVNQPSVSETLLTSLNSVAASNMKPGDGALASGKTVTSFCGNGSGYGFMDANTNKNSNIANGGGGGYGGSNGTGMGGSDGSGSGSGSGSGGAGTGGSGSGSGGSVWGDTGGSGMGGSGWGAGGGSMNAGPNDAGTGGPLGGFVFTNQGMSDKEMMNGGFAGGGPGSDAGMEYIDNEPDINYSITPDDRKGSGIGKYTNGGGLSQDSTGRDGAETDRLGFTVALTDDAVVGETTDEFLLKTYYKYNGKNSKVPGTGSDLGGIENMKIDSAVIPTGINNNYEIPYIASNGKAAITIRNGRVYLGENTDLANATVNNSHIDQKIKDMLNSAVTELSDSNCLYNGMTVTSFIKAARNTSNNMVL